MWCVYGFFMSVVLLTLLVAIMNDTYRRIQDAEEAEVG
jgi:predicted PurR-regulated permease PerM